MHICELRFLVNRSPSTIAALQRGFPRRDLGYPDGSITNTKSSIGDLTAPVRHLPI